MSLLLASHFLLTETWFSVCQQFVRHRFLSLYYRECFDNIRYVEIIFLPASLCLKFIEGLPRRAMPDSFSFLVIISGLIPSIMKKRFRKIFNGEKNHPFTSIHVYLLYSIKTRLLETSVCLSICESYLAFVIIAFPL